MRGRPLSAFASQLPAVQRIAAKGLFELIPDVGKHDHIGALAKAHRAAPPSPIASRADIHDLAQTVQWHVISVFFDEGKSHLLRSINRQVIA